MSLIRAQRCPEDTTTKSHRLVRTPLAEASFGPWVLATVAARRVRSGLFSLAEGPYREVDVPDQGGC